MIVVFGSINVDLVTSVPRLPAPGETVAGRDYRVYPGGKGANQALAARRAGADVALVGAVGRDPFAEPALALLDEGGVDLTGVARVDLATGVAMIAVDHQAENQIVVASGANLLADAGLLEGRVQNGNLLLLQCELSLSAILAASKIAHSCGARIILNAAPAVAIPDELGMLVDFLIVNEHEATEISRAFGFPDTPEEFARAYAQRYQASVIVTLGKRGAIGVHNSEEYNIAAPTVKVVDSTGAGDSFVGAFAAAIGRGAIFDEAMCWGVIAGALAVQVKGTQPSAPFEELIISNFKNKSLCGRIIRQQINRYK